MGCGQSSESKEGKQRNEEIENQLKRDKMNLRNEIKMLLLGAGESGKSTILKQMKLIHEGGYSRDERESFREIIFSNTVQSMRVILEAMESLELPLDDQRAEYHVQTIFMQPAQIEGDVLPPEVGQAIKTLWADAGVQAAFQRSREYQLNDSAKYYFDSIDTIASPTYVPSDPDVLRSRVKTTGITETTFIIGDLTYRMFDVGGQRSERKKWIHCFENVTTILFLVAISEYDQLLFEDETVNRMQEALTLFDSICNSRWFTKTSIILFLNKIDRFKEKLPVSPMKNYFPDYEGGQDYGSACDYILNRFVSLNQHPTKQIYTHFTCATDTMQIRFVMAAVNDIIIQENLRIKDLVRMTRGAFVDRRRTASRLFHSLDMGCRCQRARGGMIEESERFRTALPREGLRAPTCSLATVPAGHPLSFFLLPSRSDPPRSETADKVTLTPRVGHEMLQPPSVSKDADGLNCEEHGAAIRRGDKVLNEGKCVVPGSRWLTEGCADGARTRAARRSGTAIESRGVWRERRAGSCGREKARRAGGQTGGVWPSRIKMRELSSRGSDDADSPQLMDQVSERVVQCNTTGRGKWKSHFLHRYSMTPITDL
nr:guanine nucleotide-binding protein subunit alpha [Quercus suber]